MRPDKFNIVIVNDFAHIDGGAGRVALTGATALADRGHSVHVFSAVAPVMPQLEAAGVNVICLDQYDIATDPNRLRAAAQGTWNHRAYRAMSQLLETLHPSDTVVHFHVWSKSLSSSVNRIVYDAGFPAVLTVHDYFLACPNGGFFNYRQNRICRLQPLSWQCVCRHCDKTSYGHKLWRVMRQTVQRSRGRLPAGIEHFITISSFSERIIRPSLPKHARVHRVDNPIFVRKREPASPQLNSRFLFLGRLDREKGPTLLAQAARQVEAPVTFVGKGSCSEEVRTINPAAEMSGWIDQAAVMDKLQSARALIFPSLWYETQGLSVLEAAAVGVPAVVPDSCAAAEMVEDGVTGLIFRSGSVNDLARKLKMLADDHTVARMGGAAYDRYWHNPATVEKHVRQLEHVYMEVQATPRSLFDVVRS